MIQFYQIFILFPHFSLVVFEISYNIQIIITKNIDINKTNKYGQNNWNSI